PGRAQGRSRAGGHGPAAQGQPAVGDAGGGGALGVHPRSRVMTRIHRAPLAGWRCPPPESGAPRAVLAARTADRHNAVFFGTAPPMSNANEKRQAGEAAIRYVEDGAIVGVGTGSTVAFF